MCSKTNKNLGFSLLPFAFIFLFEPAYSLLDPLPDFIGYIILCFAIINLSDINSRIRDAFVGFRRAAMLSVARFASIYLLNKFFVSNEQNVGILLFLFIFTLFELIILIPAYKNLFDGLKHLGTFHDGTAFNEKRIINKSKLKKNKDALPRYSRANKTEAAHRMSVVFVVLRSAMQLLPEFTTLRSNSLYEFVTLLRIFSVILALPFGICWLVRMVKYCSSVRQDAVFINNLTKHYEEFADKNQPYFLVRNLSTGMFVIIAAFLLSADLYSDHLNLLPDFIFFACLILGAVFLRKYSKKWVLLAISGLIGIVASALHHTAMIGFNAQYDFPDILRDLNAYNSYYVRFFYQISEVLIFVISIILTVILLWDVYMAHTDYSDSQGKQKAELKRRYISYAIFTVLAALLSAAGDIYYVFSQPFYFDAIYYSYSLIISLFLDVIFMFAVTAFIGFVSNSVKYKYRLYL